MCYTAAVPTYLLINPPLWLTVAPKAHIAGDATTRIGLTQATDFDPFHGQLCVRLDESLTVKKEKYLAAAG
jgi:hypothetical protein